MNIFAISSDPIQCAQALDDKRLNKMIVETCQILCAALHLTNRGSQSLYKAAYLRHPIVLWATGDERNYAWLYRHLLALFEERSFRTGKRDHRSARLIPELGLHVCADADPAAFENCTAYKTVKDVHAAYRQTLCDKWQNDSQPPRWTNRGAPEFYKPQSLARLS